MSKTESDISDAEEANGELAPSILIVEDEALFSRAVAKRLSRDGYEVSKVDTIEAAKIAIDQRAPDLMLLDMRLPDGSGTTLLEKCKTEFGDKITVIVMTAFGDLDDAIDAMKLGAADYLKKPVDLDELAVNVAKVFETRELSIKLDYSQAREESARDTVDVIGESEVMQAVTEQVSKFAQLGGVATGESPTILITGETGTGKDLIARAIHAGSARANKPFVHVDCASLPKDLIEAELFGHVKGAFTSAIGERTGLIEAAEDGVVFLDEIGEVPLELQAKLLALLERRRLRRVGSSKEVSIGAWFIAATNRDLAKMVEGGEFRSDLYFRLNVLSLSLPPLRNRADDAVLLARYFAEQCGRRYGFSKIEISDEATKIIRTYAWPGNVRELSHVIERAVLLGTGQVDESVLGLSPTANTTESPVVSAPASAGTLIDLDAVTLDDAERLLIEHALSRTDYNVSEAARQLGVTRMTMRYRMKKHDISG